MVYYITGWVRVRIVGVKGNEYRIRYPTGEEIWVHARNLRRDPRQRLPQQTQRPAPQSAPRPAGVPQVRAPEPHSSGQSGTPEETARIAAAAGKFDIVGIKLGMPIKDALLALKAHNPKLRLKPESIKYDVLPYALTYGISALPLYMPPTPGSVEAVLRLEGHVIPHASEAFYFSITMPPNREVVWKISRLVTFSKNTAPTGEVVAGDLLRKYGPATWDSGPASLNDGARDMFWVNDLGGNRLQVARDLLYQCAALTTFKMAVAHTDRSLTPHLAASNLQMHPGQARARIEQGYFNSSEWRSEQCASYAMIQVRLFDTRSLGITTPGLVGGLLVSMANGPLDQAATNATHAFLMRASRARAARETEAAKQNRPKL